MKMKQRKTTIKLVVLMEINDNFLDYELAEVLKGNTDVEVRSVEVKKDEEDLK